MTAASALTRALYRIDSRLENGIADDPARSDREKHAVYLALSGIRSAESRIESAAYWLRSSMERTGEAVTADQNLGGYSLGQQAADYDQACNARDLHWAALAALLTETELLGYRAARKSAREVAKRGAAGIEAVARKMFPAEFAAIDDDHPMDPAKVQAVKDEVARQAGDPR